MMISANGSGPAAAQRAHQQPWWRAPVRPRAATRPLAAVIDSGFRLVLAVQAVGNGHTPGRPRSLAALVRHGLLVASVPVAVEVILLASGSGVALRSPVAVMWVLILCAANALALAFGWRTWRLFSRAGPDLDTLLAGCPGRTQLVGWLVRALSIRRQVARSLFWAAVACLLLWLTQPAIKPQLEIGLVSYVSVGWTGAIGGNCLYWIVALSEFGRRVLRQRSLNLTWHSPASTPGLTGLSDTFAALTIAVLAAFLLTEVLAVQASRYGPSAVLSTLANIIPVASAVAALLAGIIPHGWLYLAVRDARRSALVTVGALISQQPPTSIRDIDRMHTAIDLYRLIETSPGLPFNTTAMIQYGATVLGTLLAYLLG